MERTAKLISYIFHPLLVPTIALIIILFYFNPTVLPNLTFGQKWLFVGIAWTITFLAPVSFILLLYFKGEIKDIYIYEREKRKLPMMLAAFCSGVSAYQLQMFHYPDLIVDILWLTTIGIGISFIINLFWKISLHAMGAAALSSIIFTLYSYSYYDYSYLLALSILIAGIIGTARLSLKAHSLLQVLAGYAIGSLAGLIF